MSMFKATVLATMMPLAFAAPAIAQQVQGNGRIAGPQMLFSEMDLDGNGAVTFEEMQGAREGWFARTDIDGDGVLTRAELVAQAMTRAEAGIDQLLERADADRDGSLSVAELDQMREARRVAAMQRMFDRVDADGDGEVTEAEFADVMDRAGARRGGRDNDRGRSRDDRRGHGHGFRRG